MNIPAAIKQKYPNFNPGVDFVVRDDGEGQFISEWNTNLPKPTEEELQIAWDEYQVNPRPVEPSIEERLQIAEDTINFLLGL